MSFKTAMKISICGAVVVWLVVWGVIGIHFL